MSGEKSALMGWFSGRRPGGTGRARAARVVLVEDGTHLDPLRGCGLIDGRTTVFAPSASTGADARVVGYEGLARGSGDELAIGDDFVVQVQGYAVSQFLTVLGPTVVRVDDDEDLDAFLADADHARSTGSFPEFLINPAVVLADLPAFGSAAAGGGPDARVFVAADGTISTSPAGLALGRVGDPPPVLRDAWRRANAASAQPCAVSIGARVTERRRAAGLAERSWLARYLIAGGVVRRLLGAGVGDAAVSGFGARLHPLAADLAEPWRSDSGSADSGGADSGSAGPETDPDIAMVAWTADTGYLVDPPTGRLFAVSHRVAGLIELAGVLGPVAAAAISGDPDTDRVVRHARDTGFTLPTASAMAVGR